MQHGDHKPLCTNSTTCLLIFHIHPHMMLCLPVRTCGGNYLKATGENMLKLLSQEKLPFDVNEEKKGMQMK